MPKLTTLLAPVVVAVLFGYYWIAKPPTDKEKAAAAKKAEADRLEALHKSWHVALSPAEREEKLIKDCEAREVGYREELAAEPDSWKIKAKLAMSLLETNASRNIARPERLEEGRKLAEEAYAAKPKNFRTMIAKVDLMLAEPDDIRTEEASTLALEAVHVRQNRFTNICAARALHVDGCALACAVRRAQHRKAVDPPNAVYAAGKEPDALFQSYMKAGLDRLVNAGKHYYTAFDSELFERDNTTYGKDADPKVAEALFVKEVAWRLPLIQLENIQKQSKGVHPDALWWAGSCDEFVGRKFDGKICPGPEPSTIKPKKKAKKARKKAKPKVS